MELHFQDYGGAGNPPIVLLHGLLGSSRNWVTVSALLKNHYHVFALDARNHGNSPHDHQMDFITMANDVLNWMNQHGIDSAHVVGHSMGGKTAMVLACNHPQRVDTLTIADIAPRPYNLHFRTAFDGMRKVDPSQHKSISAVEKALAEHIDDPQLRQFLVTNLKRNDSGTFNWKVNLQGLTDSLMVLSENPLTNEMRYHGKTLLLHGEKSTFVEASDHPSILHHFPNTQFVEVPGSGHNVHVENRQFFAEQLCKLGA